MKHSDPLKRPRGPVSSGAKPRPSLTAGSSNGGSHPQSDGLLSANFGTEFSGFSYLPGRNDLSEAFSDFEYLSQTEGPRGGHGVGASGIRETEPKVL